jgi:hypothetical protein
MTGLFALQPAGDYVVRTREERTTDGGPGLRHVTFVLPEGRQLRVDPHELAKALMRDAAQAGKAMRHSPSHHDRSRAARLARRKSKH